VKRLTRVQVEGRKERAASFTESVLEDPDRADEIRDESVESYAERRHFQITNPDRRRKMRRRKTAENYREENQELKEQVRELEEQNENLQDQLDSIAEIVAPDDESDDPDEGDSDLD
jgi:predicted RNase H-like nuclease (RuvC/YqgF family)